MNSKEYCKQVIKENLLIRKLTPEVTVVDDGSPLVSLKDKGLNLIYESSIMPDYSYMVREDVVQKLGRISKALEAEGKLLIIRSVWRSFAHQRLIWDNKVKSLQEQFPDKAIEEIKEMVSCFIAPEIKSMHATGGAVDALIYDGAKDCVLDFGTNDGLKIDLNEKCYPNHPDISDEAKKNRALLIDLFEKEDFVVDVKEYWHFDFGNAVWAIKKKKLHAKYDVIKT